MARTYSATEVFVAVGVSAIVGLGVGFVVGKISAGNYLRKTADIVLTDPSGKCQPSDPLPMSAKHRDLITWRIENRCKSDYFVKFDNFKPRIPGDGLGTGELVVNPDAPERRIPTGVTLPIEAHVRDEATYHVFKYDVLLKGTGANDQFERLLDPDIEIWP